MGNEWQSWWIRNERLRHLDADLAPPLVDEWKERPRNWWPLLTVPVMPLVGLAVLGWGAVMFVVAASAGSARVVWEALPRNGTTRRSVRYLLDARRKRRGRLDD